MKNKNILGDFILLENKQTVDTDNFKEEIHSVSVMDNKKFKEMQYGAKIIVNLLNYTNNKIHEEIIPVLIEKKKFNEIDNRIKLELEPILNEQTVLEIEIMDFITNNAVSPLIYHLIQKDSVKQYNLPCEYMFVVYKVKDKTKKGLLYAMLEDTSKINADMHIYKIHVSYDNVIVIIYDNAITIITKDKSRGVIDVYSLERPDMIDFLYFNFGDNLVNIHKVDRFLLNIDKESYNLFMSSYLRRYLFMSTLFKV